MKKRQGFTLIELLAVIVILAVIALIATPLIMGTITKAKKNAFKDTAYGILKAGEKYTAEILLKSENTYEGETITLPNHDKLDYKGQDPIGGQMIISKQGDISLVIYNNSWCVIKKSSDKDAKVEKYNKNTCKIDGNQTNTLAQTIINKNTNGNQEGLFTDDFGNIRYRGSNSEVKNYVTFNNEVWRIVGIFDGKVKLIRNDSVREMKWSDTNTNHWNTSSLKTYLNGEYYNSLSQTSKSQIEASTFYLGGHTQADGMYARTMYEKERGTTVYSGNPTTTIQNIGLMYPSDYGYAARSSCSKDLLNYHRDINCSTDGNWLFTGTYQWLQTPRSDNGAYVFLVFTYGIINGENYVADYHAVRPVVHLKSSVGITGGDGTSAKPYIIG
ncbi:MAG: type II secretion system protein [Firmicutes bacterium]|nr:type II secretion system protein [Bacillota bacterium]